MACYNAYTWFGPSAPVARRRPACRCYPGPDCAGNAYFMRGWNTFRCQGVSAR